MLAESWQVLAMLQHITVKISGAAAMVGYGVCGDGVPPRSFFCEKKVFFRKKLFSCPQDSLRTKKSARLANAKRSRFFLICKNLPIKAVFYATTGFTVAISYNKKRLRRFVRRSPRFLGRIEFGFINRNIFQSSSSSRFREEFGQSIILDLDQGLIFRSDFSLVSSF
jgi:hypothetical protein